MQLSALRQEVLDRAGMDSSDGMITASVLTRLVNAALREVANMRDWDWYKKSESISTVVGQTVYDRADDARTSTRLEDGELGLLKLVTASHAAKYRHYTGRPMLWYIEAGQIVVVPEPTDVRTLVHTYLSMETPLVDDTDEPTCPDYAIDLVIVKAALKVAARTDNTSQHRLLAAEEADVIASLTDDARRSKGAPTIDSRRDWI